jgi:hypothetical protein
MLTFLKVKMLKDPIDTAGVHFDGERLTVCGTEIELREHWIPNAQQRGHHRRLSAVCPRCGTQVYGLLYNENIIGCAREWCLGLGVPKEPVETGGWG